MEVFKKATNENCDSEETIHLLHMEPFVAWYL